MKLVADKYLFVCVFGVLLAFFGIISVTILQWAFPIEYKSALGIPIISPNLTIAYAGIVMLVVGILTTIVGTYLRDKEKERKRLEEIAKIRGEK